MSLHAAEASRKELEAKKAAEAARRRAEDRATTGRVELTERFYARPRDLFECFTDPGRVQAFTQSPAQASSKKSNFIYNVLLKITKSPIRACIASVNCIYIAGTVVVKFISVSRIDRAPLLL